MRIDDARPAGGRYDLIIVGAGPAGLSAAAAARRYGLSHLVLEQGEIAQTIADYPLGRPLHSPPHELELRWGALNWVASPVITRERILDHYREFASMERVNVRAHEPVDRIEGALDRFTVHSSRGSHHARRVLIATGGFGQPRRLNVHGEDAVVSYHFTDGTPYRGLDVLVVGGGNSAAEAALALQEAGARVTLSLRRPSFEPRGGIADPFTSVKVVNQQCLRALHGAGALEILYCSCVTALTGTAAVLRVEGAAAPQTVRCAHVFALLGADPDLSLLRQVGAAIDADGRPIYEFGTYETTVPGLYVAGHLTRELHIPNAVAVAGWVVRRIAGRRPAPDRGLAIVGQRAASLVKALRLRNAWVRRLVQHSPRIRRLVQAIEASRAPRTARP